MNNLDNLRKQVDKVDEEILKLLGKRVEIVKKIGQLKKQQGKPVFDKKRWQQILESSLKKSEDLGLSKVFVKNILQKIHQYSLQIQKKNA